MMIEDTTSFSDTLDRLRNHGNSTGSNHRDPRSVRCAAVTSALIDVIDGEVTPIKVYSSALETLEGTLHQDLKEMDDLRNCLGTQTALLKIIQSTLSYVAPVANLATLATSSRVLQSLIVSCDALHDNTSDMDTKDGLGGVSSVLRSVCKTTSTLLQHLPPNVDDKKVRQFLNVTLFAVLSDQKPSVRAIASEEVAFLVSASQNEEGSYPLCPTTQRIVTSFVCTKLSESISKGKKIHKKSEGLIEFMQFLEPLVGYLNFTKMGTCLMEVVVSLFTVTSTEYTAHAMSGSNKELTMIVQIMHCFLSTILALLDHHVTESMNNDNNHNNKSSIKEQQAVGIYAARVLSTLAQCHQQFNMLEQYVDEDTRISGRIVYGQVILAACQGLVTYPDVDKAVKLLPLLLQIVLTMSIPDHTGDTTIADNLMPSLGQVFRLQAGALKEEKPDIYQKFNAACLPVTSKLIHAQFEVTWSTSLRCLAILLLYADSDSYDDNDDNGNLCRTVVRNLIQLRCEKEHDKESQRSIDSALLLLMQGIGIEHFWKLVDLNELYIPSGGASSNNSTATAIAPTRLGWLFPLMKSTKLQSGGGGGGGNDSNIRLHLSFFHADVLSLARHVDNLSQTTTMDDKRNNPKKQNMAVVLSSYRQQVSDMWSLFPIFCQHPLDLSSALPQLVPILIRALKDSRYPEILAYVSGGLDLLAAGVRTRTDDSNGIDSEADMDAITSLSERLLPVLFKVIESLHVPSAAEDGDNSSSKNGSSSNNSSTYRVAEPARAVASLARYAPKKMLQGLFTKMIRRLLETSQSQDDQSEATTALLVLARALIVSESLDSACVSYLYRSLKALIRTDETSPKVQKQAYKALSELCSRYQTFICSEGDMLKDIYDMLMSTSITSHPAARPMRIKCLDSVVIASGQSNVFDKDLVPRIVGEALLCMKESNAKNRSAAFKLLHSTHKAADDTMVVLQALASALASKTSMMRSAAVTALSRLVFDYGNTGYEDEEDATLTTMLPSLAKTILSLSDDPSREVFKSVVGFARVYVSVAPANQIEPLLPEIIGSVLQHHASKSRFRSKIKLLLKKLTKMFGLDAITPLVPAHSKKLLEHMKKEAIREQKKKMKPTEGRETGTVAFNRLVDSDDEDGIGDDDGDDDMTFRSATSFVSRPGNNKRSRSVREKSTMGSKSTRRQNSHSNLRLNVTSSEMDLSELNNKALAKNNNNNYDDDGDDDGNDSDFSIEFDNSGKMIISEREGGDDDNDETSSKTSTHSRKVVDLQRNYNSNPRDKSRQQLRQQQQQQQQKGRRGQQRKTLGSKYKSSKAGGDMKKKGQKFDPYAFVPLDGRSFSKKYKQKAVDLLGDVVPSKKKRRTS